MCKAKHFEHTNPEAVMRNCLACTCSLVHPRWDREVYEGLQDGGGAYRWPTTNAKGGQLGLTVADTACTNLDLRSQSTNIRGLEESNHKHTLTQHPSEKGAVESETSQLRLKWGGWPAPSLLIQ